MIDWLSGSYAVTLPSALHWPLSSSIAVTSKLGVSGTETEHMPIYLRTFLRLLSSWVHGEKSERIRGGKRFLQGCVEDVRLPSSPRSEIPA